MNEIIMKKQITQSANNALSGVISNSTINSALSGNLNGSTSSISTNTNTYQPYIGNGALYTTYPIGVEEAKLNMAINFETYEKISEIKRQLVDRLLDNIFNSHGKAFDIAYETLKANGLLEDAATVMRHSKISKITDDNHE